MGKVFAYARVSTPRQGEKGVSLHEQRSAIERYAEQHRLEISRWFEERDSAAKAGRGEFTEMLRLLRLKVADGVVIHKIDRSARNLEDWTDLGKLVDAGADIHFATENLDLKTVAGRLSADIQAVVAAHYSRNLREEAKKGFYGRLKQGYYPLRAPVGYLDQGSAKPKVFDPERAPLVRDAFALYASGKFSLPMLTKEMFQRGLRNREGGRVSMNGMATMLKNPFYIGVMKIARTGETFRGVHESLIETNLFATVQAVLAGKRVDRSKIRLHTYSRIAHCATCNYSLIAEQQKGHTYYRCHNRPFKTPAVCPTTSIREDRLDQAVQSALAAIDLNEDETRTIHALLEELRKRDGESYVIEERSARFEHEQISSRLSNLADLLLEGTVDRVLYRAKQESLLKEKTEVEERLRELESGGARSIDKLQRTVELAERPSMLYKAADVTNKRDLLKTLLSNLTVSSTNVAITLSVPFRIIAERNKDTECRVARGTCRTWEQILNKIDIHVNLHPSTVRVSV
jgi:site-specific DNA recombinase